MEFNMAGISLRIFLGIFLSTCLREESASVPPSGTLANMTLPEIPWGELCEAGLIDLLHRLCKLGRPS